MSLSSGKSFTILPITQWWTSDPSLTFFLFQPHKHHLFWPFFCNPKMLLEAFLLISLAMFLLPSLPSSLYFQDYMSFVTGPLCLYTLSPDNLILTICQNTFIKHRSGHFTLPCKRFWWPLIDKDKQGVFSESEPNLTFQQLPTPGSWAPFDRNHVVVLACAMASAWPRMPSPS